MIDQAKEHAMTLEELRVYIKRNYGIRKSWESIYRWTSRIRQKNGHGEMVDVGGIKCRHTGQRIYLESLRVGRNVVTSLEAYHRFVARCSEGRE